MSTTSKMWSGKLVHGSRPVGAERFGRFALTSELGHSIAAGTRLTD